MIKVGQLFKTEDKTVGTTLCQIISFYDKRDIDPECPQSVAIVSMVKAMWMSGPHLGKEFRVSRKTFNYRWEVVNDA